MQDRHELLIVGGGVTGTALLYAASRYSTLQRIGLVEKYSHLASVNSSGRHNSQTLHCGDIETNYTLEKALHVKQAADMLVNYASRQPNAERLMRRYPKMVLAVGEEESRSMRQRYETFSAHYPSMQWLEARQIAEIEPNVARVKGKPRPEYITAMGAVNDYTAVDYNAVSHAFASSAQQQAGKRVQLHMQTRVASIEKAVDHFRVITDQGVMTAETVVVSAGAHSLLLAQQMGYGLEFSVLPMAGSFYFAPRVLNGKVYTVQNDKLPFAAIHGDPDMLEGDATRFGPTALMLPMLERYNYASIREFLRVFRPDRDVLITLYRLLKDTEIRRYVLKNFCYEIPGLRRHLFLRSAQKIVPSLRWQDLRYARGYGGLRPQLIDRKKRQLQLGEARIHQGDGIIFNMTPSPGATSCLQSARDDLVAVCQYLNARFDSDRFDGELSGDSTAPVDQRASSTKTGARSAPLAGESLTR